MWQSPETIHITRLYREITTGLMALGMTRGRITNPPLRYTQILYNLLPFSNVMRWASSAEILRISASFSAIR